MSDLLPSYLTLEAADLLAAQLPGLAAYKSAPDDVRPQLLAAASQKVDSARRWQGQKFDCNQLLEFPRVPYPGRPQIWDWDQTTSSAVVPMKIKLAVLVEANSIADGARDRIASAIDAGLTGQSTGSVSEQYRQAIAGQAGVSTLCRDAENYVARYVLRSGALL